MPVGGGPEPGKLGPRWRENYDVPTFDPTETEDREPSVWKKTLEVQGRTHEEFFPQNLAKVLSVETEDRESRALKILPRIDLTALVGTRCRIHTHWHDTWRKDEVEPLS